MPASDGEAMMLEHFIIKRVDQIELLAKRRAALPRTVAK